MQCPGSALLAANTGWFLCQDWSLLSLITHSPPLLPLKHLPIQCPGLGCLASVKNQGNASNETTGLCSINKSRPILTAAWKAQEWPGGNLTHRKASEIRLSSKSCVQPGNSSLWTCSYHHQDVPILWRLLLLQAGRDRHAHAWLKWIISSAKVVQVSFFFFFFGSLCQDSCCWRWTDTLQFKEHGKIQFQAHRVENTCKLGICSSTRGGGGTYTLWLQVCRLSN